ncbi:MAG: hypothetical protein GQ556_00700 [Desulfobacterales bacterium]|nr:hypothetical protein [Desulfobacterales bacterium]
MIENMIITLAQGKVGWAVFGMLGLIATVFAVYYISFAIYLIVASAYSGFKLIPESYRIWREDLAADYGTSWGGAQLGVTMPDGGEPVEKEEEEKEEKEEKA